MSNMGYCRFENTLEDLKECYQAEMDAFTSEQFEADLSPSERAARKRLIELMADYLAAIDYEY